MKDPNDIKDIDIANEVKKQVKELKKESRIKNPAFMNSSNNAYASNIILAFPNKNQKKTVSTIKIGNLAFTVGVINEEGVEEKNKIYLPHGHLDKIFLLWYFSLLELLNEIIKKPHLMQEYDLISNIDREEGVVKVKLPETSGQFLEILALSKNQGYYYTKLKELIENTLPHVYFSIKSIEETSDRTIKRTSHRFLVSDSEIHYSKNHLNQTYFLDNLLYVPLNTIKEFDKKLFPVSMESIKKLILLKETHLDVFLWISQFSFSRLKAGHSLDFEFPINKYIEIFHPEVVETRHFIKKHRAIWQDLSNNFKDDSDTPLLNADFVLKKGRGNTWEKNGLINISFNKSLLVENKRLEVLKFEHQKNKAISNKNKPE